MRRGYAPLRYRDAMQSGTDPPAALRGPVAAELSRRDFLQKATVLGVGALVMGALPAAERLLAAEPAAAAVPPDGATLQAFADTVIPGRKAARTDLGDEIDPRAIAGVDPEPGAVEADALRLYRNTQVGFPALAPAFLGDLALRSLGEGGPFLALPYARRVEVAMAGLGFSNPDRVLFELAAAIPFIAFCAAATQRNPTSRTASGLSVLGHPGTAPNGYRSFSYRRRLSRGRTRNGNLR